MGVLRLADPREEDHDHLALVGANGEDDRTSQKAVFRHADFILTRRSRPEVGLSGRGEIATHLTSTHRYVEEEHLYVRRVRSISQHGAREDAGRSGNRRSGWGRRWRWLRLGTRIERLTPVALG